MAVAHGSTQPLYLPLLKGKKGEFDALRELPAATRSCVLPLVEVPPIPWDYKKKRYGKSLEQHLAPIAKQLETCWGSEQSMLIDLYFVEDGDRVKGIHPLTFVLEQCNALRVRAVPVTGFGRPNDFQAAVAKSVRSNHTGACLRVTFERDCPDPAAFAARVESLRAVIEVTPEDCDLLIDLREVSYEEVPGTADLVAAAVAALPHVDRWRSLTLAGSGFPATLSKVARQSEKLLPRTELWLWRAVCDAVTIRRPIVFGDYAIAHPDTLEVDKRQMKLSANLRYTLDEHWLILKGLLVAKHGCGQFRGLCRRLISSGNFMGANTSPGDAFIADCAAGARSPGNATTWRQIGTTHHVALVTTQLSNRRAA